MNHSHPAAQLDLDPRLDPRLELGALDLPGMQSLPDRPLTRTELVELARAIAADPDTWAHHVRYSPTQRHFVSLYRDTNVEAWLICWTPVSDTGWHDHDVSAGAVAVAEGAVVEHSLTLGGPEIPTVATRGSAYSFGPDHIHRMTGRDPESATVHVYSPPLWRMGQYTISSTGILRRLSVSYADELRPLDPA